MLRTEQTNTQFLPNDLKDLQDKLSRPSRYHLEDLQDSLYDLPESKTSFSKNFLF